MDIMNSTAKFKTFYPSSLQGNNGNNDEDGDLVVVHDPNNNCESQAQLTKLKSSKVTSGKNTFRKIVESAVKSTLQSKSPRKQQLSPNRG
jgi:hypothetical protein